MSIIDTTHVDVAVKTAPGAAAPATTPVDKPSGDGGDGAAKTTEASRPDSSSLISGILDKHGLSSPEELAEFVDRIAETAGQIGDNDPDELLKAKTTLDAYQRKWTQAEQARLKEAETPEQTIERLEREAAARDNAAAQRDAQKRKAESAKAAVKTYNDVITSTIRAEKDIPESYIPILHALCGVGSPVNTVDISNRGAVKKIPKEFALPIIRKFQQDVIADYRAGKTAIPVVPSTASETTPVADQHKPKNLADARAMAKIDLTAKWGPKT